MFSEEEIILARLARTESRLDYLESLVDTLSWRLAGTIFLNIVLVVMLVTGFFV